MKKISIEMIHGTHTVLSTGKTYSAGDVFEGTESMLKGLHGKAILHAKKAEPKYDASSTGDDDAAQKLKSDLEELGVEVDGRWGVERLQSELDKALANADSDA